MKIYPSWCIASFILQLLHHIVCESPRLKQKSKRLNKIVFNETLKRSTVAEKTELKPVFEFHKDLKLYFQNPAIDSQFDNSSNIRLKREASGVIEANNIHAERIKTNKLFSNHVTADIVKANNVKSIIISIGKAFSLRKARRKTDNRETFILKRNGIDPTDTSVTIVLKRDDSDSVNINGYNSDTIKQKKYSSRKSPFIRNLAHKTGKLSSSDTIQNAMNKIKTNTTLGSLLQNTYLQKHQSSKHEQKSKKKTLKSAFVKSKNRHINTTSRSEVVSTLQKKKNMRQNRRKKNFMLRTRKDSQNSAMIRNPVNFHDKRLSTIGNTPKKLRYKLSQNKDIRKHQLFKVDPKHVPTDRFLKASKRTQLSDNLDVRRLNGETDGVLRVDNTLSNQLTTNDLFAKKVTAETIKAGKIESTHISIGKSLPLQKSNWYTDNRERYTSNNKGAVPPMEPSVSIMLGSNGRHPVSINQYTVHDMHLLNRKDEFVRKHFSDDMHLSSHNRINNDANTYKIRPTLDNPSPTNIINEKNRLERLQHTSFQMNKYNKHHLIQHHSTQNKNSFSDFDSFEMGSENDYSEIHQSSKSFKHAKRINHYDSFYNNFGSEFSSSEENGKQKEMDINFMQTDELTSNILAKDKEKIYSTSKHLLISETDDFLFS
ncbi:unnamed protein product [Mytilus coruscus]|uniref:Uncharacterized protein n=1 Tax=Mytilus coruscus TaxID=42192 RepID=A0A6J8AN50_MYTCO|nr:unnamed protein product [Mytilus coruscus]